MCGDFVSNSTQNKKTKQQCGPQGKQEKHTKGKIKRKSQSAILCFQSLLAKNHTVEEIRPKMLLVKMMVMVMVMVMMMMMMRMMMMMIVIMMMTMMLMMLMMLVIIGMMIVMMTMMTRCTC